MLKSELLRKEITVEQREYYWKSDDGLKLYSQVWLPGVRPRAVILLIHGLTEYGGRYSTWAEKFAASGFVVKTFDLRGHGFSMGKGRQLANYKLFLRDVIKFITQNHDEHSGLPVFVYGHSFGGNLVLNNAIWNKLDVKGLIITSPWLNLSNNPPKFKKAIVTFLSFFIPGLHVSSKINPEDLSRDLRVVHDYRNDNKINSWISPRLYSQASKAGYHSSISIYRINIPLLVMHGASDNITSCDASRNFVRNAGPKTTYKEWEGGYHELHNDIDKEKVFRSIVSWIEENLN